MIIKIIDEITNKIRTKYLTREDIENEGWTFLEANIKENNRGSLKFAKNQYVLYQGYTDFTDIRKLIQVWNDDKLTHCIFEGECKSINEFHFIMKLLNI